MSIKLDSQRTTLQKTWCRTCMSSLLPIGGQFTPFLYDAEGQIRDKLQRRPMNSRVDQGERRVTRSLEQLIHETVAAQRRLCLPHMAPSINKPSARGDETIWTWTSEENILFPLIIRTHTDLSVFLRCRQRNPPTWSAPIDSSAAQWCEIKGLSCPVCERSTSPLGAGERTLCKQDRQKDQSRRPYLLA